MLHGRFLGRFPSHFHVNPLVKAYIISESVMWSAWNFALPIFAVFIVQDIKGGNVQTAASGYSIFLISRVLFELLSGRLLLRTNDDKKVTMAIIGMICLSCSYLGFAFGRTIPVLFVFYFVAGMGVGLEAPAKNALFSMHLDENKEATEWSLSDAIQFFCMALATAVGGFIALKFGFRPLFLLAFAFTVVAIAPYVLYNWKKN